jgi:hypothetical protein
VLVEQAQLSRADQAVTGDLGAGVTDQELAAGDGQFVRPADEAAQHAVARPAIADGAQPVDLAQLARPDGRPQRGQRAE